MTLLEESLSTKQQTAISRLYSRDATVLVAPTGAGKTVMCLSAIKILSEEVIVAVPAKVLENNVWGVEVSKWDHLKGLRVASLVGTPNERLKTFMHTAADVFVVSLNNLNWLIDQGISGVDGIIIDELSKAAGKQTAGLKSKKKSGSLKWRVGMTATPVSQNFEKLYALCRIIDKGNALGTNKQSYLDQYFYSDYQGYNWTLRDGADAVIMRKVGSLVHLVEDDKATTLPALRESVIKFDMPDDTRVVYNDMKKHMIAGDVEAANEAVKSGKLRQIASGFMYGDDDDVVYLDDSRVEAMRSWVDALDGKNGIIFYEFVEQGKQLVLTTPNNVRCVQIQSMSHGVDGLQHIYADLLFLQPPWSRDNKEQAIGRVWRTGQTEEVNVTTLVCNDTLDALVMQRVEGRGEWMKLFKQHLEG
jgi:SNF2 family DNA or RNA helicase